MARCTEPARGTSDSVACHFAEELDLVGVEFSNFLERLKLV